MTKQKYDLFISYNRADTDIVEVLASELKDAGMRIWFDKAEIVPGEVWHAQVEEAIAKSSAIGICIGPKGSDKLVEKIVELALLKRQLDPSYQVIPILLPGSGTADITSILRGLTFVDLRDGIKTPEAINTLAAAVREGARTLADTPVNQNPHTPKLQSSLSIPMPPAVGFVQRRDSEGRDLVERLKDELSPQKNQLVALWGEGGVGKTTLAAEAARSLNDVFAQRIVWISADVRGDLTLSTLLNDIATQLGRPDLRPLAQDRKEEEVRALLTAAPALIVLDNFETIAVEEQMNCMEWIAQKASCPTLTTSRQLISAARNITISSMSFEEADELLVRLITQARDPSVFLSLDHARVVKLAEANPQVLQWMVAQIDLSPEPEALLSERISGKDGAAQRVFERYFSLPQLTDDGRAALLALSLFMPNATRNALATVAGLSGKKRFNPGRLDEAVKRLAELGLVRRMSEERSLAVEGLTRELTKARLLKDGQVDEYLKRFVAYFLDYAEVHAQPTPEDLDALESEKENILTAMDVAFKLKDWESVMRLMNSIAFPGILDTRGYWDEAIQRSNQAAKAARSASNDLAAAYFTASAANIRQYRGEFKEARRAYHQALSAFKSLGSDANIAATLQQLGNITLELGDLAEAKKLYNEALAIAEKLGDQQGIASISHQLGRLAQLRGDLEEARWLYMKASEIARKLQDRSSLASTYHQLGMVSQLQGDLKEAQRFYKESLDIEQQLGDQSSIASTVQQLGLVAQNQGDLMEARKLYNESLEIKKKLGDQGGIAISLHNLGMVAKIEGNQSEAVSLLRESLSIFEKLKSPYAEMARRNLKSVEPTA
ncbi:MAG TPA: tetratricopeptide repeat protein [Pyrinomonadaceae bacterium]|jgi:tetratricopeptide (TPR) repeat protein|nr:tetratricopeptide repeat protein [Pyrinomonadaceae bacterium]